MYTRPYVQDGNRLYQPCEKEKYGKIPLPLVRQIMEVMQETTLFEVLDEKRRWVFDPIGAWSNPDTGRINKGAPECQCRCIMSQSVSPVVCVCMHTQLSIYWNPLVISHPECVYNRHVKCNHSHITPADDPAYKLWAADLWKYTAWTPEELVIMFALRAMRGLLVRVTHHIRFSVYDAWSTLVHMLPSIMSCTFVASSLPPHVMCTGGTGQGAPRQTTVCACPDRRTVAGCTGVCRCIVIIHPRLPVSYTSPYRRTCIRQPGVDCIYHLHCSCTYSCGR